MRNKALHTIFPDNATVHLDDPVQTAFADILPATQTQLNDDPSGGSQPVSRVSDLFGAVENPAQTSSETALPETLMDVSKNLDRLRAVTEAQITETTANTAALGSNTAAKSVGQTIASVGKAASGFLGGLTSFPLISGLVKLFGGGSDAPATQPALPKYEAPASLAFDRVVASGSAGSQIGEPTYDQFGNPKVSLSDSTSSQSAAQLFSQLIPNAPDSVTGVSPSDSASYVLQGQQASPVSGIGFLDTSLSNYSALLATVRAYAGQMPGDAATNSETPEFATSPATSVGAANTQITVNIQAMDSRSFLDRSQDIAQAVREAMLNMHSINDVVNDL